MEKPFSLRAKDTDPSRRDGDGNNTPRPAYTGRVCEIRCNSCQSKSQSDFPSEGVIFLHGLKHSDKSSVWVFPELAVCMDCGFAKFSLPENELRVLVNGGNSAPTDLVACKRCSSGNQRSFNAGLNIHHPHHAGLDKPAVQVSPHVVVCLDCGFSEFAVQDAELHQLANSAVP